MKKPLVEKFEIEAEKYNDPENIDSFCETHFCPICGKEVVKYCYTRWRDKGKEECGCDYIENDKGFWVDPYTCGWQFLFFAIDDADDEECVLFDIDEVNMEINSMIDFKKMFIDFYKKYIKQFDCYGEPYFCSSDCLKQFMLKELKQ